MYHVCNMKSKKTIGAIILAAGRGSRMKMDGVNKVTLALGNKPMICHTVELVNNIKIKTVVVVVGFAKESVQNALEHFPVIYAKQKVLLGTAHAVKTALKKLPSSVTDVLIIQGDDSAFYTQDVLLRLINTHLIKETSLTFLTLKVDLPFGLGRVVRNAQGEVEAIVEEKDASLEQKRICEINPACYVMNVNFLQKYLPKMKKSPITGEYYLTRLIDLAVKNKEAITTVQTDEIIWRGVNTKEELEQAQYMYQKLRTI